MSLPQIPRTNPHFIFDYFVSIVFPNYGVSYNSRIYSFNRWVYLIDFELNVFTTGYAENENKKNQRNSEQAKDWALLMDLQIRISERYVKEDRQV